MTSPAVTVVFAAVPEREIVAEEDVQSTNKEESWGQGETAARGSISLEEAPIPQETVTGYKLFRQEPDGQLYPLFVDADNPIPMDKWYKANSNVFTFTAENGKIIELEKNNLYMM